MAKVTKNAFFQTFLTTAQASSAERAEKAAKAELEFEQTQDTDIKRLAQKNACHAKWNLELANKVTEAGLAVAYKYNLNVEEIVSWSRESKKRLIGILNALGANDKTKLDKPMQAWLADAVANDKSEYTLKQLQHIANHATTTQAGFWATVAVYLGAGERVESTLKLDMEKPVTKALFALYD